VVDNNSQDATVEIVKGLPKIKLIENKKNVGFSTANNQAVERARGEILFFLNPDARVLSPELFRAVHKVFHENTCVGVRMVDESGETVLSGFSFEAWWMAVVRLLTMDIVNLRIIRDKKYIKRTSSRDLPISVDWVSGGAMFIPRNVYKGVGGYDNSFFLYSEDVDLCKRIKEKGFQVLFLPYIAVYHEGSHSSRRFEKKIYFRNKSYVLYACKHYARWQCALFKSALFINLLEKFAFTAVLGQLFFGKRDSIIRMRNYLNAMKSVINNDWKIG